MSKIEKKSSNRNCETLLRRFTISLFITFGFGIMNAIGVFYEYTNRTDNYFALIFLAITTMILIVFYLIQVRFIVTRLIPIYKRYIKIVTSRKK